jgi:hypothetical protein
MVQGVLDQSRRIGVSSLLFNGGFLGAQAFKGRGLRGRQPQPHGAEIIDHLFKPSSLSRSVSARRRFSGRHHLLGQFI